MPTNKKIDNKVYVGNLAFNTKEEDLRELFKSCGKIVAIEIPTESDSERQLGHALIEFSNEKEAQEAVDTIHGKVFGEEKRQLKVNISREPRCRSRW